MLAGIFVVLIGRFSVRTAIFYARLVSNSRADALTQNRINILN
jgi:hypothetical protein